MQVSPCTAAMQEFHASSIRGSFLQTRMDQRGDHMEMCFEYFKIQKWMLETERKK